MNFKKKIKTGDYVAFDACFSGAQVGEVIAADRLSLLVKFDGEKEARMVARERCMLITEEERERFHELTEAKKESEENE